MHVHKFLALVRKFFQEFLPTYCDVRVLHTKYILRVSRVDRISSCQTKSLKIVIEFPKYIEQVQLPKHFVNKAIILGCINYVNQSFQKVQQSLVCILQGVPKPNVTF